MNDSAAPAAWRQGEQVRWVGAGALPPRVLAEALETGGVFVVVATDAAALAWAAGTGAGLLLSTTPRTARDRLLSRGPAQSGVIVSSIDSLHSAVLRADVAARFSGVPWCVWWADRLAPVHPGHGGREAWVERYYRACGGAGLLWVYSDARSGEGLEQPEGEAERIGSLLPLADGPALAEVFAHFGRGVVAASVLPAGMGPGLQGAGLPLRSHGASRGPGEQDALERLREGLRGVDHLIGEGADSGPVFGRVTALPASSLMPADLLVPPGTALVALGDPAAPAEPVTEAAVASCLAALEACRVGEAFAFGGAEPAAPIGLVEDLEAVGALRELRSAWFSAVVSDQHRLRPPFTDRDPAFAAFHEAYAAAQGSWSLQQQADLSLTDRAPQDLRRLAGALGLRAVDIALVLRALDHESVVTARLRPVSGDRDWEALPGPKFSDAAESLAAAVNALRARRSTLIAEAGAWIEGSAVGSPLEVRRVERGEDVVVAPLARLPGRAGATGKPISVPPSLQSAGRGARADTEGLFSGLSAHPAPPTESARPTEITPQRAAELLESGDSEQIAAAIQTLGAGGLLARASFDHRAPGRPPAPPDPWAAGVLFQALAAEASPSGLPANLGAGVQARRAKRGRLEVDVGDGPRRGVHRFEPRVPADRVLRWAWALGEATPEVAAWRATELSSRAWSSFVVAVEERVLAAAEAEDPDSVLLSAPVILGSGDEVAEVWRPLFEAVETAVRGDIDTALAQTEGRDRADLRTIEAWWLGASGRWARLAEEAGLGGPRRGRKTEPTPRERLAARALPLCDPLPSLDGAALVRWMSRAPRSAVTEASFDRLLSAVTSGRPRDFSDLAARGADRQLSVLPVARRAMALGALPSRLARELLEAAGADLDAAFIAEVLLATTGRPGRADAAWQQLFGPSGEAGEERLLDPLRASDDPLAESLLAVGERRHARRRELEAQRERILRLDQDGRSEEAARALSALPASDRRVLASGPQDLQATRAAALARLNGFGAVLARVLASAGLPDAERAPIEAEALAALDDAAREGWLELVLQALRAQHRRHPDDPHRGRWLALALGKAGRWPEAEEAWSRSLESVLPAQAREFGLDAAECYLRAREDKRAVRAIERLVAGSPDRGVGNRLAQWAEEGLLQGRVGDRVARLLRGARSGVYAAALRRLS